MPASSGKSGLLRIGLISDTHGLLRPEALAALRGSDHIVHAGDIGDPAILELLDAGGVRLYVIHDVHELDLDPAAAGFRVVVSGHSHRPARREKDGVLYLNPGSAGPRRFSLPVSAGRLLIQGGRVEVELLDLAGTRSPARAKP